MPFVEEGSTANLNYKNFLGLQNEVLNFGFNDGPQVNRKRVEFWVNDKGRVRLFTVAESNKIKAQALLPGNELYALRLWNRGLLVVTVINYLQTTIGKYIEYSIAIACTHGAKRPPRLLPGLFMGPFSTGQYVVDLPVSSEISRSLEPPP